jgi:hypothetical protein
MIASPRRSHAATAASVSAPAADNTARVTRCGARRSPIDSQGYKPNLAGQDAVRAVPAISRGYVGFDGFVQNRESQIR